MQFAARPHFIALGLIAVLAFGIERLIVTDAEAIEALGEGAAAAIEGRDFETLEGLMDEEFKLRTRDRASTLALVQRLLREHKPVGVRIQLYDIQVEEDQATAKGLIMGQVYGRPVNFEVEVVLIRSDDEWRLLEVKGDRLPR